MSTTVFAKMQQRYDTAANWTAENPVLLEGEIGIESDTDKFKFGDGTTAWNSLDYASAESIQSLGDIGDVTLSGTPAQGSSLVYIDGAWRIGPALGPKDLNTDPNFANVKLLLKGNGSNNGTIFTDSSATNFSFLTTGPVITSTEQSKYLGSSIRFGYPDYTATNIALYATSGFQGTLFPSTPQDWTIEMWVYINSTATNTTGFNENRWIFNVTGQPDSNTVNVNPALYISRNNGSSNYNLIYTFRQYTSNQSNQTNPVSIAPSQWHHIAIVRVDGVSTRLYVNGVQGPSIGNTTNSSSAFSTAGGTFVLGSNSSSSTFSSFGLRGYIEDFRITHGVARYTTSTYTVPPATFPAAGDDNPTITYPLSFHDDVSSLTPSAGQTLIWNQTTKEWEPGTVPEGALASTALQPTSSIGDLADVEPNGPAAGATLVWNGSQWVKGPILGGINAASTASLIIPLDTTVNPTAGSLFDQGVTTAAASSSITFSSSIKKIGSGSAFFNNAGGIFYSNNTLRSFFTGQSWTMEMWLYPVTPNADQWVWGFVNENGVSSLGLKLNSSAQLYVTNGATTVVVAASVNTQMTLNSWNHVAVTFNRTSTTATLFVNGFNRGSGATVAITSPNDLLSIGGLRANIYNSWNNRWGVGYMDNILITLGLKYSSNFTPSEVAEGAYIPYTIDRLEDVDTTTAAPTNGQALLWNGTNFAPASVVQSNAAGVTGASSISNIIKLSQADYDNIGSPDSSTLYVITD